ncbi:hypothetical protein N7493_010576 [Penicillium malachiteum]|uniref:Uncharacterized protein n=1 Tax=Penicillium malachiteum TaxID=1324776 RepID=A0AAD6HD01_9EURO|nr:hypothetical protein N7493_010576 [Penicillium malachiteum]
MPLQNTMNRDPAWPPGTVRIETLQRGGRQVREYGLERRQRLQAASSSATATGAAFSAASSTGVSPDLHSGPERQLPLGHAGGLGPHRGRGCEGARLDAAAAGPLRELEVDHHRDRRRGRQSQGAGGSPRALRREGR